MPKELVDKLTWLFILLPGFLCMSIVGSIVELGQLSEFQITFYSFVLTLVITAISLAIISLACRWRGISSGPVKQTTFFVVTIVVSVLIGLSLGLAAEGDRFFVALRALPITNTLNKRSAARPVVFLLTQNTGGKLKTEGDGRPPNRKQGEAWALIQLKNGKRFEGWPEFYETGSKPSELYLSPACEETSDKGNVGIRPIEGPGIVIYESEIQSIELLDRAASKCYAHWAAAAKPSK